MMVKVLTLLVVGAAALVHADGGGHSHGGGSGGHGGGSGGHGGGSGGHGGGSGGGDGSSGYAAPSSGYGASSGSGGAGGGSSGYGAPSSGYGAPSSGYGAPSSGYGGSGPIYVYKSTTKGGGGLGALLPLGVLALAIPLGLLALTLPVTTTIIGGRRKRELSGNMTLPEKQAALLQSYLDVHGLKHDFALQRDMIAKYLECGGEGGHAAEVSSCLEKLMCTFHDTKEKLTRRDKEVASIILQTIMENEYISKVYKKRLLEAGQLGEQYPGSCDKFHCNEAVFYQTRASPSF